MTPSSCESTFSHDYCSGSIATETNAASEAALWNALRQLKTSGLHFRRQVPLGRYYADFACHHPKFVVEVDGWTHNDLTYDAERDRFMEGQGYRVLRVPSAEVLTNIDAVVRVILSTTGRMSP